LYILSFAVRRHSSGGLSTNATWSGFFFMFFLCIALVGFASDELP
jgi:hypothetical protein